jgi:hypothetical protein
MSGTNPQYAQGTLNRILTQVTFGSYPALNIASYNMGKSFAVLSFNDAFTTQIDTGTGIVNSPEPYVKATISVGILRTQSLAAAWLAQVQNTSIIGSATGYSDTTTFPAVTLTNVSILGLDPGAYDGNTPVTQLTLTGLFYPNSAMWGG